MEVRKTSQLLPINLFEYRKRGATLADTLEMITQPTRWDDANGKPMAIYTKVNPSQLEPMRQALMSVKYVDGARTQGMVSRSRIFGYAPRVAVRNLSCRLTSMGVEQPDPHGQICNAGLLAWDVYKTHNPEQAQRHNKLADENVLDQWKIHSTPFTSGIANHNNPLVYHFDSGNFKDVWSAMFVLRDGISGGHLSIPELGVALECSDCSLVLFDGQSLLHGVTPINKLRTDAYRYSVVYYSLQGMWNCNNITDELAKMRQTRTEIEQRRCKK